MRSHEAQPARAIDTEPELEAEARRLVQLAIRLVASPGHLSIGEHEGVLDRDLDLQSELGITSLGLIELSCMLEEAFGLDPIPGEAGFQTRTVGDLDRLVWRLMCERPSQPSLSEMQDAEFLLRRSFEGRDSRVLEEGMQEQLDRHAGGVS